MISLIYLRNTIRKSILPNLRTNNYTKKSFSITKQATDKITNITTETKCCIVNKIPIVELGQSTIWTHPHLFDESQNDQVIPGLTKTEFERRRDTYVKNLIAYQMHYFKSKLNNSSVDIPNFIAVIPSAMTTFLSPDVPHMFKQNSDFLYLTGFKEPNSVLVISKTDSSIDSYKTALFVKERNAKTELWEGPCSGPSNIKRLCGIENAYPTSEFMAHLNSLSKDVSPNKNITLWRYPTEFVRTESGPNCENLEIENHLDEFIKNENKIIDMSEVESLNGTVAASYYNTSRYFVQLGRVKKSTAELNIMRKACDISREAFINSMNLSHPLINEHLIHAKFDFDCKVRGAERLAYIPVIAGGARATTLHYIRNNQIVNNNSMLLMDAGCEYREYASDITRTWPINGKFTRAQSDLYQACLNVQLYCIEHCCPGITLQQLYNLMMRKLGEELTNLGLIDKKFNEMVTNKNISPMKRLPFDYLKVLINFCPHDIGHYLGLDVHDSPEVTKMLKLEPGSVITIEPGIYIRADNKDVPENYRGIGIRIEDDVAITSTGCEILSKDIPKTINEIESLMQG